MLFPINDSVSVNKTFSIYIDPGHGGFDGGAIGIDGTIEKDINLNISKFLKDYLEDLGFCVYLTRDKDIALAKTKRDDILKRVDLINNPTVDMFISIHLNAFPNKALYGAQVFYKDNLENKLLSECIQKTLSIVTNTKRVSKAINDKYLIDHTNKLGCLVEAGFLSNDQELALLKDLSYQKKIAYCIYVGILDYLAR